MITKEQALTAREFHCGDCQKVVGPRGGIKIHQVIYRRNGKTKTWKTRPEEFRVPVKRGFYDCESITEDDAEFFHTAEDCPLNREE